MCSIFLTVIHKVFLLGEKKGPEGLGKKLQRKDSNTYENLISYSYSVNLKRLMVRPDSFVKFYIDTK